MNESAQNAVPPMLSIVIPAYNEESRLPQSLDKIIAWKDTISYSVEVLIVENGSTDRTTEVAESYAKQYDYIRLLHSDKGKGAAVRQGMLQGNGEYLLICDSDLSMPIAEVDKFLPPYVVGYDVVIGSREAPGAVRYNEPHHRHVMGRVFNFIVQVLAVRGFHDTQCGFKLFKWETARHLFAIQTVNGWTFDVEILFLARKYRYKITEVPIHWYYNADSRVSPLRDTWAMFWDVVKIRFKYLQGTYVSSERLPQSSAQTPINNQHATADN